MSGLSRTPGKRVYGESRTAGSNPALSAIVNTRSLKVGISAIWSYSLPLFLFILHTNSSLKGKEEPTYSVQK